MFGDSTAAGSGRGGIGMSAAGPRLPGGCTSCPAGMSGGGRGSVALQGAGSGSCGGPQPCATPQQSSSTAVRSSATAGAPARLPPDAEREQGLRVIAAQSATSLCSCTIVHLPQTGDRQAPVQPPQASTVWTALPRQRASGARGWARRSCAPGSCIPGSCQARAPWAARRQWCV